MLEFEKMKKCKYFFEKTRKKFFCCIKSVYFSIKKGVNGDFCFKIGVFALLLFSNCQCAGLFMIVFVFILTNLMYLRQK